MRRHADRRWKISVLSTSGGHFRANRGCDFSADRSHAGPGSSAQSDGDSGGRPQQFTEPRGAKECAAEGTAGYVSPVISVSGATAACRYDGMATAGANLVFRDR